MTRIIDGLVSAKMLGEKPGFIPQSRPRGRKAAGKRYEREFAKAVRGREGVWWEFVDKNGPGVCQTDSILELGSAVVIFEAKYTYTRDALVQLKRLYEPVLRLALRRPILCVVVCKVLTDEALNIVGDLDSALAVALAGRVPTLHWLPGTPLPTRAAVGVGGRVAGLALAGRRVLH